MEGQNEREASEKKAKLRAMHLLERMDRTEEQLRTKLSQDYEEDIVEIALEYVKSFGYINDTGYASRYVENRKNLKSKLEIKTALLQKGISKEIVQNVIEEAYKEQNETEAIHKILEKKRFFAETATDKEKQKMYGYLIRKGFRYDEVRQVIQVSSSNA